MIFFFCYTLYSLVGSFISIAMCVRASVHSFYIVWIGYEHLREYLCPYNYRLTFFFYVFLFLFISLFISFIFFSFLNFSRSFYIADTWIWIVCDIDSSVFVSIYLFLCVRILPMINWGYGNICAVSRCLIMPY